MKQVIGLTGENGSGKETFTSFLQALVTHKTIQRIRSSDVLAETLKLWGISLTRSNLQLLPVVLDKYFGQGSLSNAVYKRIQESKADIIIFDGVRWPTDVKTIRKFPKSLLVYITADPKLRFNRLKLRSEKVGEKYLTPKQFAAEEKAPTETEVPKIGKQADFKVDNNGTLADLEKSIKEFVERYI